MAPSRSQNDSRKSAASVGPKPGLKTSNASTGDVGSATGRPGTTYMQVVGAPTLGDRSAEAIDCWFVEGGKIVFLIRESREAERTRTVVHGPVRGGEVVDGRIVWTDEMNDKIIQPW